MGVVPFIRRREQTTGLTFVVVPHERATEPNRPMLARADDESGGGMAPFAQAGRQGWEADVPSYSSELGGRGRPVFPGSMDALYYLNPWTMAGGEGASWEWEHFGHKLPVTSPALSRANPSKVGAANHPLAGRPAMIAWPERANIYRAPFESYSNVIDQRAPGVPVSELAGGAVGGYNPLI